MARRKTKTIHLNREKITKEDKDRMMARVQEGMTVFYKIVETDWEEDENGVEITTYDWSKYEVGQWYIWQIRGYKLYELDGSGIDITEVIFDENDPKVVEYLKTHKRGTGAEEYINKLKSGGGMIW